MSSEIVGESSPPCVPLSYKWKIHKPTVFLKNLESTNSPPFKVYLPRKNSYRDQVSTWHLKITNTFKGGRFHINLVQGWDSKKPARANSSGDTEVLVSDYKISILNPETEEVVQSITERKHVIEIDEFEETELRYGVFFNLFKIEDEVLIVKVDATLFCITDPHETVNKVPEVPMDNIRQELHKLYKDEVLTDVVFKCGDRELKAHRAILASQSPVFKTMFEVDMKEKETGIVNISEVDPEVVSEMLTYIYTGKAPNICKHAKDLLNIANQYELNRLFTMCQSKLITKIKDSNVLDYFVHANLHNAPELRRACLQAIKAKADQVLASSEWTEFKADQSGLAFEVLEYTSGRSNVQ